MSGRTRVVLVDINFDPDLQTLAPACLRSWAMQDAELAAACVFQTLFPLVSEDAGAIAQEILRLRPDVVGFSTYVWNVGRSLEVVRLLKKEAPGAWIVLGGPYAGPLWAQMLQEPEVDFVATGEGEETLRKLLRHLSLREGGAADVPGLAFRRAEGPTSTPAAELIDGSRLGCALNDEEMRRKPRVLVETSRGCPFTCKFCDWGERQMRYIPLRRLTEDFRRITARYGHVMLTDADILMNRRQGLGVIETFLKEGESAGTVLSFCTNPTFLTREAVDLMGRAPERFSPRFGVQTVVADVLAAVERVFDARKVEENLVYLRTIPVMSNIELIMGLPADTRAGFESSVDWAFRQSPWFISMYYPYALPGADLYKHARELGVRYDPLPPHAVLSTATLSERDMRDLSDFAFHAQLLLLLRDVRSFVDRHIGGSSYSAFVNHWMKDVKRAGLVPEVALVPTAAGKGRFYPARLDNLLNSLKDDRARLAALSMSVHQTIARLSARACAAR